MASREDVILLAPEGGIGIELGIAEGEFASRVCSKNYLSKWYGVDAYAGGRHNQKEMNNMLKRMEEHESFEFIHGRFEDALRRFDDEYFDIVYVDGFAHTGQHNGSTIEQWYAKVKKNGIISGDDYCERWPLNMKMVDRFIAKYDLNLNIIGKGEPGSLWSSSPSWYAIKK